jgi:translation elongation factor EF-4
MLPQNVTVVIFRKRKLLENRKRKETHETSWNVEIPQEAFMAVLKLND